MLAKGRRSTSSVNPVMSAQVASDAIPAAADLNLPLLSPWRPTRYMRDVQINWALGSKNRKEETILCLSASAEGAGGEAGGGGIMAGNGTERIQKWR